ncbi:hypothetical protein NQ318_011154 [Aromia moschata]|uniref:Helicase ATP-binding domain-containing protein n=1 Tax=Aromia moschata TaxID=1265417 RepID=A0AAV8YHX8_9CUCU|nr:hypothetical protein NQ318_011154 [Aromia moschata]
MSTWVGNCCRKFIKSNIIYALKFSTFPKDKNGQLIISCKRKYLDHYSSMYFSKLDEVPLASKGWNHSKSKDDQFTIYPLLNYLEEEYQNLGYIVILLTPLKKQNIRSATEFQAKAITTIQSGNNALLAAETGCGKTISYLLPIIQYLIGNKAQNLNTPKALVIVPNRELAYQVGEVCHILGDSVGVNEERKKIMMNPEYEEVDILVATPGALGKLSTIGMYKLHEFSLS